MMTFMGTIMDARSGVNRLARVRVQDGVRHVLRVLELGGVHGLPASVRRHQSLRLRQRVLRREGRAEVQHVEGLAHAAEVRVLVRVRQLDVRLRRAHGRRQQVLLALHRGSRRARK